MNIQGRFRVTVVVGAYNNPKGLDKTLQSLVDQEYSQLKVVVIDDNCPSEKEVIDKTYNHILKYKNKLHIEYIKNNCRIGVPYVFKKWIDSVDTEFFMLYGDGDIMIKHALAKLVAVMDENPNACLVHGGQNIVLSDGTIKKTSAIPAENKVIDSLLYLKSRLIGGEHSWSQMAGLIRTEQFKLKVEVVHDWYWDHYFHCQFHLFNEEVVSIPEIVVNRDSNEQIVNKKYDDMKLFRHRTERKLQSLDFIERYERILLSKNMPVSYFRLSICLSLFIDFFCLSSISKKTLVLKKILTVVGSLTIYSGLSILLYPTRIFGKIILNHVNKDKK